MVEKITTYQTAEQGKFEEILDNSLYPAVSVTRWRHFDESQAFPDNAGSQPVSSVEVYPKYAVLTKLTNPGDIKITLSGGNVSIDNTAVVTLLNAVTGQLQTIQTYTDDLERNTFDTASACDDIFRQATRTNSLLNTVTASNVQVPGFSIPPYTEVNMTYIGSTNNFSTVVYKNNTTTVMSLSFTYQPDPPTSNDALLVNVKKI
jgi:hypothetical protein